MARKRKASPVSNNEISDQMNISKPLQTPQFVESPPWNLPSYGETTGRIGVSLPFTETNGASTSGERKGVLCPINPVAHQEAVLPITGNSNGMEDETLDKLFPPGYRFCPYDHELIIHYLKKKINNEILPRNKIEVVDLYSQDPEKLAEKFRERGDKEGYFFTPRNRKYPNGNRPNRGVGNGYWKATGCDTKIFYRNKLVGYKKVLVFYEGKPLEGIKTNWIMHEYKVHESETKEKHQRTTPSDSMKLDDWVLCKVYKRAPEKSNTGMRKKNAPAEDGQSEVPAPISGTTDNYQMGTSSTEMPSTTTNQSSGQNMMPTSTTALLSENMMGAGLIRCAQVYNCPNVIPQTSVPFMPESTSMPPQASVEPMPEWAYIPPEVPLLPQEELANMPPEFAFPSLSNSQHQHLLSTGSTSVPESTSMPPQALVAPMPEWTNIPPEAPEFALPSLSNSLMSEYANQQDQHLLSTGSTSVPFMPESISMPPQALVAPMPEWTNIPPEAPEFALPSLSNSLMSEYANQQDQHLLSTGSTSVPFMPESISMPPQALVAPMPEWTNIPPEAPEFALPSLSNSLMSEYANQQDQHLLSTGSTSVPFMPESISMPPQALVAPMPEWTNIPPEAPEFALPSLSNSLMSEYANQQDQHLLSTGSTSVPFMPESISMPPQALVALMPEWTNIPPEAPEFALPSLSNSLMSEYANQQDQHLLSTGSTSVPFMPESISMPPQALVAPMPEWTNIPPEAPEFALPSLSNSLMSEYANQQDQHLLSTGSTSVPESTSMPPQALVAPMPECTNIPPEAPEFALPSLSNSLMSEYANQEDQHLLSDDPLDFWLSSMPKGPLEYGCLADQVKR